MCLQNYLILQIDFTEIYQSPWSRSYTEIIKECLETDNNVQQIYLGEAHSVVISEKKLYTWGWNGNFVLGRDTSLQGESYFFDVGTIGKDLVKAKQFAVSEATNMFIDKQDQVWVFGQGVRQGIHKLNFSQKAIQITGRQDLFYIITQSLKPYFWKPLENPQPQQLSLNIQISSVSLGIGFVILVSAQGLVLSFGEQNSAGQLGLGDNYPRSSPEVVEELKNKGEKVVQVECGCSHVICRTSLKKVYTWGWGQRGQLGHEDYKNLFQPKKVYYREQNQKKCIQVAAGYRSSLLLLDNGTILWAGSNGTINQQNEFEEIN